MERTEIRFVGGRKFIARNRSHSVTIDLPRADVGARKEAVLKIADSCLVHETIKNRPEINIDLG